MINNSDYYRLVVDGKIIFVFTSEQLDYFLRLTKYSGIEIKRTTLDEYLSLNKKELLQGKKNG